MDDFWFQHPTLQQSQLYLSRQRAATFGLHMSRGSRGPLFYIIHTMLFLLNYGLPENRVSLATESVMLVTLVLLQDPALLGYSWVAPGGPA